MALMNMLQDGMYKINRLDPGGDSGSSSGVPQQPVKALPQPEVSPLLAAPLPSPQSGSGSSGSGSLVRTSAPQLTLPAGGGDGDGDDVALPLPPSSDGLKTVSAGVGGGATAAGPPAGSASPRSSGKGVSKSFDSIRPGTPAAADPLSREGEGARGSAGRRAQEEKGGGSALWKSWWPWSSDKEKKRQQHQHQPSGLTGDSIGGKKSASTATINSSSAQANASGSKESAAAAAPSGSQVGGPSEGASSSSPKVLDPDDLAAVAQCGHDGSLSGVGVEDADGLSIESGLSDNGSIGDEVRAYGPYPSHTTLRPSMCFVFKGGEGGPCYSFLSGPNES